MKKDYLNQVSICGSDDSIYHAGRKPIIHPDLGVSIVSQTAIRYFRFCNPVIVERIEWPITLLHGGTPTVPIHPAHLLISVLNRKKMRWEIVKDVNFPFNEMIAGKGLTSKTPVQKMQSFFNELTKLPPYSIQLGKIKTDHLRVECDREHPGWPNHQEFDGGCFNVPFGSLSSMKVFGCDANKTQSEIPYLPVLTKKTIRPRAPKGMKIIEDSHMIRFEGPRFSVGFSTRRPMLTHLGWDYFERGNAGNNRLLINAGHFSHIPFVGGFSGPMVRLFDRDGLAQHWTGEVSIIENRIIYSNLYLIEGLKVDAEFTVYPDRLILKLSQNCKKDIPVIEGQTWRFAWDMRNGLTGTTGLPTNLCGRNGDIQLPIMFTGDGIGCLAVQMLDGNSDNTRIQAESYRKVACRTAGIILAPHPKPDQPLYFPSGKQESVIEISVSNIEPATIKPVTQKCQGIKTTWSSVFTTFRPEYGGFSNNAISIHCMVNQMGIADVVCNTKKPPIGPNPIDLAKFTTQRMILDGGGYGYYRNFYMDSDPNIVCAAGKIYQVSKDKAWVEYIKPGMVKAVQRIMSMIAKPGLLVCRNLSGNSGSFRWSSNAMDIVGFGHIDGYSNALAYRALRNASALLEVVGESELSSQSRECADMILANYSNELINPKTGWLAAWKSRDGQLHDHASLYVNSVAIAFGLLKKQAAVKALTLLENLRLKVGIDSGELGLPLNLLPIPSCDHMLPKMFNSFMPTFENYTDGTLTACHAGFYLRALSIYGFKKEAKKLADDLEKGYAKGFFHGKYGQGPEFKTWDGMLSGYEGTFGPSFAPLYAIAVGKGFIKPLDPEWWPE